MNADRGVLESLTVPSEFVGYTKLETNSVVTAVVRENELVDGLREGEEGDILLDVTPFYAESGGQVADVGTLSSPAGTAQVLDVKKAPHGQHLHRVRVVSGQLKSGQPVRASVQADVRRDIVKNHTATHLLHKALREVLGEHVAQAGSLVEGPRLRFDFSHFGALTPEELADVERRVNDAIWRDDVVDIRQMDIDEAKAMGAMALFGEKYGKVVRVVKAGDYSIELCGGCHVERTGLIGLFKITSETGIGAGVRRIEAVTGRHAYAYVRQQEQLLQTAAGRLKSTVGEFLPRLDRVLEDIKQLERDLESAVAKLNRGRAAELLQQVQEIHGIPVLAALVADVNMDGLRQLVDEVREKLPTHVVVLGSVVDDKVQFVAAVSKDLQARKLHAGQLVKQVAQVAEGGGGGRPDLAQAGGKIQPKPGRPLSRSRSLSRRWQENRAAERNGYTVRCSKRCRCAGNLHRYPLGFQACEGERGGRCEHG
ncbi:hypothetical protein GCM10025857_34660 [Alicyclobacillus contaminans]|nr:hypothetical protein GCM10025857_34660 [Alicyclobacillus contaminans]